ncbi:ww domain containing protein [Stylonychia lemnae]|uniref:Ww domain containing protein n=1 Tax=Stylonychia lemnae TaxID=5949 RepID=A0A078BDI2_STYLE|nr:ww domain containing protein [Stylonychia lemnae]|eukprot:CDW91648.1 ww domain containing protein [Stylonychia lemnae]
MQPQAQFAMKGSGIGSGMAYNQRQPNSYVGNPMYTNNQDLMYDDEYYDEEVDFDTEEAQAYQQALQMQGAGGLTQQNVEILRAEQALGEGYEIMEEELDEDYEPTGEEIEEYAKYLGMDLNDDRDLFYIAKEGLKAPLPNPWKPCRSPGGSIYYYNFDTRGLQKEHPCDDYYKNYYLREKGNQRKKKEEKIIKKQIKEQQKKVKLSTSMNSTSQNANNVSNPGNTSIHQMALMMNMSGLDMSTSIINEKVQIELEQIMDDYEEKKIQHERKKREELKKLDSDKASSKQKIVDEAKMEVDVLKKAHAKNQGKGSDDQIQRRKTDLQIEKDKRLRELRDQERQRLLKQEKQNESKFDKKKDQLKRDEENRHRLESDNIKTRYKQRLEIERDRIREDNNRLLEESGDIDFQVRLFKSEMLEGQIESQKYDLEEEQRNKLKELKQDFKKRLEKEREKIAQDFNIKLEREKDKEIRKQKVELSKIDDKKEAMKKEMLSKLKDDKKKAEKEWNQQMREKRIEADEELDRAKNDLKRQIAKTYEAREIRNEKDFEKQRQEIKQQQDKYETQSQDKIRVEKESIDKEFEQSWQKEKEEFLNNENEKSQNYQAIIKEIQNARTKLKDLELKEQQLQREYKLKVKEVADLEMDKRGKDRQVKSTDNETSFQHNVKEQQLQKELREKQEELDRIQLMIKDKKDQQRKKAQSQDRASHHLPGEDFHNIVKDLDQVKVMIMDLKNQKQNVFNQPSQSFKTNNKGLNFKNKFQSDKSQIFDYDLSEIETFVEINLPQVKAKREKHDQDRVILRQLIANVERNRMKLRKDILGTNSSLSHTRRIAVQSVKDKIDEQAHILEDEESQIKDKADFYRRKEEKLRTIKQKIDMIRGEDKYDSDLDDDRKEVLMKDVQIDYDKYLKLYQKDEGMSNKNKESLRNQDLQVLQNKWGEYLVDEARHDLSPIISFNPQRDLFKPKSLYQKYQHSGSKYRDSITLNSIYDREIEKVKENKSKIKDFLTDQQRWLSGMRAELNHASRGAVPGSRTMMQHVGSNETLFQLKNNLSIAQYYY